MENELKRANDLKGLELRLQIWKEMFDMGKISKDRYFEALMYSLKYVEKRES